MLKLLLDIFLIMKTVFLLIGNRYDFVHAHEESVFFARLFKPLFGYKLVYDMHSSLPEQLTNFNYTKSRILIKTFKWLEDSCLQSADAVITICPALYNYVDDLIENKSKHLLIENSIFDRVRIKWNGSGSSMVHAENTPEINFPENAQLIVYAGTLESYQGIDILVDAYGRIATRNADSVLLVVGGTAEQVSMYSRKAAENGISSQCIFTGRLPQERAQKYIGMASVLVSPRSAGINTPLKIYEQLASGIPLVATNIYSHTQVLDDNVAILVDPDPDDMARGLEEALCDDARRMQIVAAAKKLYEDKYSRPVYTKKIKQLLELLS
jgi:glycosyltransferase involved in cell wall biosynthesis